MKLVEGVGLSVLGEGRLRRVGGVRYGRYHEQDYVLLGVEAYKSGNLWLLGL